ncbi:MAG: Holliday junction branch migration protein RuvA [Clostridiaceae bacterium]
MYDYIKGIYKGFNKEYIIIDNNGIGYRVYTSGNTIAKLPRIEDQVLIYIQQIVREDFIGLYGFITREELDMFNLLLTISGVGAKAALSLLSISSVNNLKYAIMAQDESNITRAPGIGKKTAQRIILELKDKLKPDELVQGVEKTQIHDDYSNNIEESLNALMALGYTEKESKNAVAKADKQQTVEKIIKECLRNLMR